jgi:eukaryotic-like serine/threonine-protein kinase
VSAPSWGHVKELLHQAIALGPGARGKFLDEVCASDAALRAELDSLLAAGDDLSVEFLQSPLTDKFAADGEEFDAAGLAAGQLFAQRFQLIRKLGEGGMGQVWLAEQTAPVRRPVALKLIKAGMYDETVVQRFQAERQSLAIMDHPAIAKVFDAGLTPQGQPYFVMEYVPGLPITEYCDQKKLKIRERVELFIQACEGVQHAHQKAIIHRDLKPANILVVEVDGKPVPRIIDFGLAKATTQQSTEQTLFTRFGQFMGTPGYMSPEQVNPNVQDIDTRTDVYSLGVILYVLLTGQEPFETRHRHRPALDEWLRRLREEEPPTPSAKLSADRETSSETAAARDTEPRQLAGLLRGDLDWITMKALERDRERRYGTPSDLAADLRRHLNDEPVTAHRASAAYQLHKFIRRHRVAAGFVAMVTVLSIAASAAALIAVRQKHQAEYQTTQALQSQSRLLIQAAVQRLKDLDVAGAQDIILEVLANPTFAQIHTPGALSVFQEIRAADLQVAVLSGHNEGVVTAAYSRDGTRIVTASRDKTARIWDARTGVELMVLSGHGNNVTSAAFSPDGTRIVTASDDKTARIWDARTGAQLAALSGHGDRVWSAVFSPDGTRIVTASGDKTARIWDARTGAPITVLSGHGGRIYSAAFSPDGTRIVTASYDRTARIWNARTGAQLAELSVPAGFVRSAAYSPDGKQIVTGSGDQAARIWDALSGKQLAVLLGHGGIVLSARFSPDGTRIVTASSDKTARIWDALTGTQLTVLSGHSNFVMSAAYSPDGTRIVTASDDTTARIWETSPRAQLAVLSGHNGGVEAAGFSPDGTRIVTAPNDKSARLWDASTGAPLNVLSGHGDVVFFAAFSPDGTRIVTSSADKTARIWEASTGTQLLVLTGHEHYVDYAAYSPDGTRVVTASYDATARIWDARTGKQLAVLTGDVPSEIYSAGFSPDGTRIVTASADQTARIWDAVTGKQLAALLGHGNSVSGAAYSPDGAHIVTASDDRTARIWDARTGAQLAVLIGHGEPVNKAAYSRNGERIVTASEDGTARIWDASTGAPLAVLTAHSGDVRTAAYSPDGTHIVTASRDGTVRIWDARVQAGLAAQILWDASAQTNALPEVDRTQLGLPPDARARSWATPGSSCDQAAAAHYDPDRVARGALRESMSVDIAAAACAGAIDEPAHAARADYQMGRILIAKGDPKGAQRQFETAVGRSYRAARVDLADLQVNASAQMLDPGHAVSLYKKAWQEGVPIAAFRLGRLYEYGLQVRGNFASVAFQPDLSQAWRWYSLGADAGEPNALARFAEREESAALATTEVSKRNTQLLQAFRFYAAAAERAREEDWPDDAWNHWRYRRASLARVLAREGMMQQVADTYAAMLHTGSPRSTGVVAAN